MGKLARRGQFERQIFSCAQARIHGQHNRQRQRRFLAEDRDLLLFAIFLQHKIFFLQVRHRSAARIGHGHEHVDQLHVDLEVWFRAPRASNAGGGINDRERGRTRWRTTEMRGRVKHLSDALHLRVNHLDAGCSPLCLPAVEFLRKRLSVGPHRSIFKVFFLPDRHRFLQRVDDPPAGVKCRAPVRRSHHDQHARLANLQPPQPVDDRRASHRKTRPRLCRQRFHLLQRHRLIGFIIEIERAPPTRVVPHHAVENHRRAILRPLQPPNHSLRINPLADNPNFARHFAVFRRTRRSPAAAAPLHRPLAARGPLPNIPDSPKSPAMAPSLQTAEPLAHNRRALPAPAPLPADQPSRPIVRPGPSILQKKARRSSSDFPVDTRLARLPERSRRAPAAWGRPALHQQAWIDITITRPRH